MVGGRMHHFKGKTETPIYSSILLVEVQGLQLGKGCLT